MELIIHAGIGLVVGLVVGAIHLWLLARSVDKLTQEPASGPGRLLMSAPLRVGVPVVALVALAALGISALAAGFVGLLAARLFLGPKLAPGQQP